MSEINANITVQPFNIDITMESPTVEVVAEPIDLNLSLGGFAIPGGNNGDLQYNQGGVLGGIPYANYLSGNLTLGNVANVKILGGTNQYFLQTDGTGNLTWQAGTGNATGNGTVGGANTQIQFNDSANFGGAAGFTFDKVSNAFNSPGDGTFVGNVTANNFIGNVTANISQIVNGNSNVVVNANANITISSNGVSNVVVITDDTIIGNIIEVNDIVLNNTAISLGNNAGTGASAIVIGNNAAPNGLNTGAIAIGSGVGSNGYIQIGSIGIGIGALAEGSGDYNIAIGGDAGRNTPGIDTVAIGINSGWGAGNNAVAIGSRAGALANGGHQPGNSLILNATGTFLQANASNTFYVKPIRNANTGNILFYDNSTGEITFSAFTGNANVANTANTANFANFANFAGTANTANTANFANFAGNVTVNNQPNITSLGTLTQFTVNSNANSNIGIQYNSNYSNAEFSNLFLGNIGSNIYACVTSRDTVVTSGVLRNIVRATNSNANILIQVGNTANANNYNYILLSAGNANTSNNIVMGKTVNIAVALNTPYGNIATGNFDTIFVANTGQVGNLFATRANTVTGNSQPNITSVGTLSNLNVTGNITGGNANLGNAVQGNFFIGDGGFLSNIQATVGTTLQNGNSEIQIPVADGNIFMNVNTNTYVTVSNIGINVIGNVTANRFSGNANNLSNIPGGNVTGFVPNAVHANTSTTVTGNSQPNITSTGNLTSLTVTGNITANNVTANNFIGKLANGNTNISLTASNITFNTAGTANIVYIDPAGLFVNGILSANSSNIGPVTRPLVPGIQFGGGPFSGQANISLSAKPWQFFNNEINGNVSLNFYNPTGNLNTIITSNNVLMCTVILTQLSPGNIPYAITDIKVDGSNANVNMIWSNTPNLTANGRYVYKFDIFNSANTNWDIFGFWYRGS